MRNKSHQPREIMKLKKNYFLEKKKSRGEKRIISLLCAITVDWRPQPY